MDVQTVVTILASLFAIGEPHGYMIAPPQRSSMWRVFPGFTPNYNDMELFCGGVSVSTDPHKIDRGR